MVQIHGQPSASLAPTRSPERRPAPSALEVRGAACFPAHLICRDSGVLMLDAVVGSDGYTYARAAAEARQRAQPGFQILGAKSDVSDEATFLLKSLLKSAPSRLCTASGKVMLDPVVCDGRTVDRSEVPGRTDVTRDQAMLDAVQTYVNAVLESKTREQRIDSWVSPVSSFARGTIGTVLGVPRLAITAFAPPVGGALLGALGLLTNGLGGAGFGFAVGLQATNAMFGRRLGAGLRAVGLDEGLLTGPSRWFDEAYRPFHN